MFLQVVRCVNGLGVIMYMLIIVVTVSFYIIKLVSAVALNGDRLPVVRGAVYSVTVHQ